MTDKTINNQILSYVQSLEKKERLNVLKYLENLLKKYNKKENKNNQILALAGSIDKSDLKKMEVAIEEGCETIDEHEW